MQILVSLLTGLIFGIGLIISGMTSPSKVINFLDVAGRWDPSLLLVMGNAVAAAYFGFRYAKKLPLSILGNSIKLPLNKTIDAPLILGSIIFGIGWGLVGYCPGPALASVITGEAKTLVFTQAMILGMALFEIFKNIE